MPVLLRPLTLADVSAITALLGSDRDAIEQTGRIPWPFTEADAEAFILRVTGGREEAWAITVEGAFIGVIGAGDGPEPEIGYWIGKPYRRQGYATEAVTQIIERRPRAIRLRAEVFPGNEASARVLRKTGFVRTEEIERDLPARGGVRRLDVYIREHGSGTEPRA